MRVAGLSALALLAVAVNATTDKYDFDIYSKCQETDPETGACLNWKSSGSIKESTCFPGDATVETPAGIVPMARLRVGDLVRAYNDSAGADAWVLVLGWTHRVVNGLQGYLNISTRVTRGTRLSADHMLLLNGVWAPAKSARVMDLVAIGPNQTAPISRIDGWIHAGIYSPVVAGSGNLYVDGIRCHVMTHVANWWWPQTGRNAVVGSAWAVFSRLFRPQNATDDYVHPIAARAADLLWYGRPLQSADSLAVFVDGELQNGTGVVTRVVVKSTLQDRQARESSKSNNNSARQEELYKVRAILAAIVDTWPATLYAGAPPNVTKFL